MFARQFDCYDDVLSLSKKFVSFDLVKYNISMKNIYVSILILVLVFGFFFFLLKSNKTKPIDNFQVPNKNDIFTQNSSISNSELEDNFRKILETKYPEFKDFENQESFAGKKVKFQIYKNDRYYAYMTLGSGVPIAGASCFRIDTMGRVFEVGVFPNLTDSYIGYTDIDPRDCSGIK